MASLDFPEIQFPPTENSLIANKVEGFSQKQKRAKQHIKLPASLLINFNKLWQFYQTNV
jgi:hypothetical protein